MFDQSHEGSGPMEGVEGFSGEKAKRGEGCSGRRGVCSGESLVSVRQTVVASGGELVRC